MTEQKNPVPASVPYGGIGMGSALFIVFLVLKLLGKIAWSWWWVTSPLWIPVGCSVAVLLVIVGSVTAWDVVRSRRRRRR